MNRQEYAREYAKRVSNMEFDQLEPKVPIVLKGIEYSLEYNNYAAKSILQETGLNLLTDAIPQEKLSDPTCLGKLIYWGLKTNHEVSEEQVDYLINLRALLYIGIKVQEAIELFRPDMSDIKLDDDEVKKEEGDPIKEPTGVGSDTGQLQDTVA